jgi:hypothetical protein
VRKHELLSQDLEQFLRKVYGTCKVSDYNLPWPKNNERSDYIFRACLIFSPLRKNKTKSLFSIPNENSRREPVKNTETAETLCVSAVSYISF